MIALGSDHGGFHLKNEIAAHFEENNIEFKDYGIHEERAVDYPDIAQMVCSAIISGECERGILLCGTGIGISIAANKIHGIRAAACSDHFSAEYSRLHNNANVLCLGGRVVGAGTACEMTDIFLSTDFQGGRHAIRVDKITKLEKDNGGKSNE